MSHRGTLAHRLNTVLARLMIADPEGPALDYSRFRPSHGEGGHGKHGATSVPPAPVSPVAVEFADAIRRLVELAEMELAIMRGELELPGRRVGSGGRVNSEYARQRKRRIARTPLYAGRPPEWVALAEGCSADTVRKTRAAAKLDPATGLAIAQAPTAAMLDGESVRPRGRAPLLTSREAPEE